MDELVELLNSKSKKKALGEIDHVLELHIYILKQSTMQKNPDPNFEAVFQQIEINAKQPSATLHKLWMAHVELSNEEVQYDSEAAFRLDQAFAAVRHRMMCLQENFRAFCRRYIEREMYQQEKALQSFSLFQKRAEELVSHAKPQPNLVSFRSNDSRGL